MGIFEDLGVTPIINLVGTATRYSGTLMKKETIEAMSEAALHSVRMDELQAAAGNIIARITGAEAAYVTCGASAALLLGTAACLTGLDVGLMNHLPDTSGIPNEVLMPQHQMSGYIRVIEATGAKLVSVGIPNDTSPPGRVHIHRIWEIESNITKRTAAICYAYLTGNHPPLEEVINVAKKYSIPVIVDAAGQVPPVSNLRKFISMGADLVAFSGGKGLQGPQASGILCGRKDLISAAALQNLDMAEASFETWNPPRSLIPKERLAGLPLQGIGRGLKVTKEAIVGLVTALRILTEEKSLEILEKRKKWLQNIATCLRTIRGVETETTETSPGGHPILKLRINESQAGCSTVDVIKILRNGSPPIYVIEQYAHEGLLIIHSINLNDEIIELVKKRLRSALMKESDK